MSSEARTAFLKPFIQAEIAPKERGGFNIESLCAVGERLLMGFRNPILEGKALLVPLENPRELVLGKARAVLGEPIFLDLGGLGFRDMVKWRGGFLIVAGDFRDRFDDPKALGPKLFWWNGKLDDSQLVALNVDLLNLNPEAALVFTNGEEERVLILSDDGKLEPELHDVMTQVKARFRSAWLVVEN